MVKVILYLSNIEEAFQLEINSAKELTKFIKNELKISNFNILFEKGEKISKNKMQKLDEILDDNKNEEILNLLVISSENSHPISKLKEELKNVNFKLDKMGGNNFMSNCNSIKNIIETIVSVHSEIKTIENQNVIMNFLENFYTHLLNKIRNKFSKINENYNNYNIKKLELDFSFLKNLEEFKKFFDKMKNREDSQNLESKDIEIKAIEKSYQEFKKLLNIFDEKLKNFNLSLNNFVENHTRFKEKNYLTHINQDDKNLKEPTIIIKRLYNEIMKNLDSNNLKEILSKIEIHWNKNNYTIDNFNEIFKQRKINSIKIKSMLDDQCGRLKKSLLDKLSELNLLNKNIENNLEITELPKIVHKEFKQLQEEIKKRKEFEYVFKRMMNYLNHNLLAEEEKRRLEFYQKMSQYSKNEIYKKVFNKFCEYHNEENKYPSQSLEEIIKLMNKIENELNLVKNKIYYNTEYDSSKNLIEKNIINTVRKETKENNLFNDRKLSTNKEEDNLMYRQEIFNKHIENLNSIQREISEILKDNFKSRDHDDKKDEYELSRANSEAVLVDKDELTDFTKKSPIIHLNMEQQLTIKEEKLISTKNLSHQELSELIETKYKNILSDLKKINEYTKLPDNSNISNTSLINSIYLSNLILNDKNTNSAIPHNANNPNHHIEYNIKSNSNKNYSEVERFVMLYEDKIYFFDTLFEYMNNFIKSKNIKFNLTRQPMALGRLIENILRNWLKTKSKFEKYKTHLKKFVIK